MAAKGIFIDTQSGEVSPAEKADGIIMVEKTKEKEKKINNKKKDNSQEKTAKENEEQKLDYLAGKSERVIYKVRTVFPFTLFPTNIVIDTQKVTLIFGVFFYSYKMFPILLKDIRSVTVSTGLLFGTISFDKEGFQENPGTVEYLWREDALKVRRIIMGMMVATKEGVEMDALDDKSLLEKVEAIGRAREEGSTENE
jgi:hypothetical protein